MKKLFLPLLLGLVTFSYAVSQVKVICDKDGESVYLDGKYKADCNKREVITLFTKLGKHKVIVKKINKDESYYYFERVFKIGDEVEKIIKVKSVIKYPPSSYATVTFKMSNSAGNVETISEIFLDDKKIASCPKNKGGGR